LLFAFDEVAFKGGAEVSRRVAEEFFVHGERFLVWADEDSDHGFEGAPADVLEDWLEINRL